MKKRHVPVFVLAVFVFLSRSNAQDYKKPGLPVEDRVNDLLSRMTLEEKVAQMLCFVAWDNQSRFYDFKANIDREKALPRLKNGLGHIGVVAFNTNITPAEHTLLINAIQKFTIENSRLGIPVIFHDECLHGLMDFGATIFPQAIAMSGTWDPDLIRKVFTAIAAEARSRGVTHAFTPMIDVVRDPRWGRTEESYGEDPYLTSRFAVAIVKGLQGERPLLFNDAPVGKNHIVATGKHFAGHGQMEGGLNLAPGLYPLRTLLEAFLPPFKAAVTEAGVLSVMPAYHEFDGIPCHANQWLLKTILREQWGFRGVVVSDYDGITKLHAYQNVAEDNRAAARLALAAGMDIDLPASSNYNTLVDQVKTGLVSEADIDKAVKRVLHMKFLLGLFDRPFGDPEEAGKINRCAAHRALALEAARKAVVLLKNEDHLLPLDKTRIRKLAVIGPNAGVIHHGGYSVDTDQGVTILQGIKNKVGNEIQIEYAEGCKVHLGSDFWLNRKAVLNDPESDGKMIAEAVETAKRCDVSIVVVGETPAVCGEHNSARSSLDLLGRQNDLVKAVLETGKPVVVFLINGRPLSISAIHQKVPAILEGWYLGEETGTAAADVLFGDINPGGKLTISFPRSAGHIPAYYNKKHYDRDFSGYLMDQTTPLFPFGFGLSYTTFAYGNLRLSSAEIGVKGTTTASVEITNTGTREGDEIVQLYIRDRVSSVTRPVKELKGFKRITLKPGETKTVAFDLGFEELAFYDVHLERVVEPGTFDVMAGSSSRDEDLSCRAVLAVR
jgi:beta-glucosidase